jgi:hypothetical protein
MNWGNIATDVGGIIAGIGASSNTGAATVQLVPLSAPAPGTTAAANYQSAYGAVAGDANLGVILAIAAVAGLVLFLVLRRKR